LKNGHEADHKGEKKKDQKRSKKKKTFQRVGQRDMGKTDRQKDPFKRRRGYKDIKGGDKKIPEYWRAEITRETLTKRANRHKRAQEFKGVSDLIDKAGKGST